MANAAVDKLKTFGLLHGEKIVVGLTAALFVACAAMAATRGTLDMEPEQLAADANSASANLDKQQPVPDVLAKIEKDGLVDPKFVEVVENQFKNALNPDAYKTRLEWVTPEPGAGLIRDQPELIAPADLAAFPGRGGVLMYALDEKGERIPDLGDEAKKKGGRSSKKKHEEKPEDKKRRELEVERKKGLFVGKAEEETEKAKEEAAAEGPTVPSKEITRGERWVVLTGVIDNEQLKKNYLLALKNPAIAYPNYKRLDIERRSTQEDGTWSAWEPVKRGKSYDILDNLPQLEPEVVPAAKLHDNLVDHLPFLKAGYWTGVHVAKLVPNDVLAESTKASPPPIGGRGGSRGAGMMMGSSSSDSSMMPSNSGMAGAENIGSGAAMSSNSGMASSAAGGPEESFTKIDEKAVMLRVLDFTVEPDHTYQFRLRIVVVNPNKDHTDVNPGVDTEVTELLGPWSEPTEPVTLPADVAAYAMAPEQAVRRGDLVNFQVIKFDPKTGQTVIKNDGAGPGELVGELGTIQVPSSEGKGPLPETIDFNSRAIVLDTVGGAQRLPDIGLERNQFVVPAIAAIIEPDGSVVIRDQAIDRADDVRDDMEANYKQAIADSGETRKAGSGSRKAGGGDPRMGGGGGRGRRGGGSAGSR